MEYPDSMRSAIKNTITDLVSNFLYYDRKDDEDLPVGEIEKAIMGGRITTYDIIDFFSEALNEKIGDLPTP